MKKRVITGVFVALVFLAALLLPPAALLPILLLLCGLGMLEFYSFLTAANIPSFRVLGTVCGLALITATWFSVRSADDALSLVLAVSTLAVFLRQFPQKNNPKPLETIAGTLLGILYVAFLFNFIARLCLAWGDSAGRLLILYLVLVVKMTDTGAYFIGCAFGRHKLIPRISPAKTWEGFFGGVLAGVVTSLVFFRITGGHFGPLTMGVWDAALLGVVLALAGTVGDLTESLFKRAAGVKDSGRYLGGMGGVLDVIDSLLFAAPVLYLYGRFFFKLA